MAYFYCKVWHGRTACSWHCQNTACGKALITHRHIVQLLHYRKGECTKSSVHHSINLTFSLCRCKACACKHPRSQHGCMHGTFCAAQEEIAPSKWCPGALPPPFHHPFCSKKHYCFAAPGGPVLQCLPISKAAVNGCLRLLP